MKPLKVIWLISSGYFFAQILRITPKLFYLYDIFSDYINKQYKLFYAYWKGKII